MESSITFMGPFEIEESEAKDYVILKACLLAEGMTGNGHFYEIEEMEKIAKQMVGLPIRFGATLKGKHIKVKKHEIGKVLSAILNKAKRRIFGRLKVWNTKEFPNIVETIMSFGKSMGISIGGDGGLVPILKNGFPVLIRKGHGFLAKVVDMIVKHVQIVPPNVPRGQKDARVLSVEEALQEVTLVPIQETLIVNPEIEISISYQKGLFKGIVYG